MTNNYLIIDTKKITILTLLLFFVGSFQNLKALNSLNNFSNSSFKTKLIEESQLPTKKNKNHVREKSSKKTICTFENTKSTTKQKKISFRKKLSILKLVLKNKHHNKDTHHTKKRAKWNGQHTAGLLSWASVLVAVMAFFTSHFLLGILALCSTILFFLLIFVERGQTGTVDDVLWLFAQIINIIVIIGSIFD